MSNLSMYSESLRKLVIDAINDSILVEDDFADALVFEKRGNLSKLAFEGYYHSFDSAESLHFSVCPFKPVIDYSTYTISYVTTESGVLFREGFETIGLPRAWVILTLRLILFSMENEQYMCLFGIHKNIGL